jgi:hypothetical protein
MRSPADFEEGTLGSSGANLAASRLASPQKMRFTAPTATATAYAFPLWLIGSVRWAAPRTSGAPAVSADRKAAGIPKNSVQHRITSARRYCGWRSAANDSTHATSSNRFRIARAARRERRPLRFGLNVTSKP